MILENMSHRSVGGIKELQGLSDISASKEEGLRIKAGREIKEFSKRYFSLLTHFMEC